MMRWVFALLFLGLTACAVVDQYGGRIYDGNINAQTALNQETLLNIVRASKFQSPNFMAVSQVTGSQSEQLTTGLPTISFGGGVTASDHAYRVSNSLASGVQSGYQSNPLITTTFQNAMLSPVSGRTIAQLMAVRPREAVLFLIVDGLRVTLPSGESVLLTNDPAANQKNSNEVGTCPELSAPPASRRALYPGYVCSYTKFTNLMRNMMAWGLSTEIPVGSEPSASGPAGRFCFDPALAGVYFQTQAVSSFKNICGRERQTTPRPLTFHYEGVGEIQIEIRLRSPVGVLNYLGSYLRGNNDPFPGYYSSPAQKILGNQPYLDVRTATFSGCYTSISYQGISYCVSADSTHTAMIMDMVQVLRNLSIQPTDLNTAFTVRVNP
jgi:hypothetical protein